MATLGLIVAETKDLLTNVPKTLVKHQAAECVRQLQSYSDRDRISSGKGKHQIV